MNSAPGSGTITTGEPRYATANTPQHPPCPSGPRGRCLEAGSFLHARRGQEALPVQAGRAQRLRQRDGGVMDQHLRSAQMLQHFVALARSERLAEQLAIVDL